MTNNFNNNHLNLLKYAFFIYNIISILQFFFYFQSHKIYSKEMKTLNNNFLIHFLIQPIKLIAIQEQ